MSTVIKRIVGDKHFVIEFDMAAAADTTTIVSLSSRPYRADGYLHKVVTIPGTKAPTDNYDPVLKDAMGADLMGSSLLNQSATTVFQSVPMVGTDAFQDVFAEGELTLSVTGNSVTKADFKLLAYIREP
jgi:hypothetical protein